jgi:hypothetical protein
MTIRFASVALLLASSLPRRRALRLIGAALAGAAAPANLGRPTRTAAAPEPEFARPLECEEEFVISGTASVLGCGERQQAAAQRAAHADARASAVRLCPAGCPPLRLQEDIEKPVCACVRFTGPAPQVTVCMVRDRYRCNRPAIVIGG